MLGHHSVVSQLFFEYACIFIDSCSLDVNTALYIIISASLSIERSAHVIELSLVPSVSPHM